MFRRAKIMFDGIPADVMATAQKSGVLVGRLGFTDPKGNPTCAAVRPPLIEWTAVIAYSGPSRRLAMGAWTNGGSRDGGHLKRALPDQEMHVVQTRDFI